MPGESLEGWCERMVVVLWAVGGLVEKTGVVKGGWEGHRGNSS